MEARLELGRSRIALYLILILATSLAIKLYMIDFSLPVNSDNMHYALMAIPYLDGDFSQSTHRGMGWSLFVSPFFSLIDSNNFMDYSNTIRILSLAVSSCCIPVMYIVCRKFFDQKYSLVGASLLAFEPHLNYNAGFGLSEPLFIITILAAFYFILNKNTRYVIPSLILAGAVFYIRPTGLVIFLIISLIYFVIFRGQKHYFRNYVLALTLFLIVISPLLLQKYDQFGDPFYSSYNEKIFAGSYEKLLGENTEGLNPTMMDYIRNNGLASLLENYVLNGFFNTLMLLSKISLPYLFILIPFGIIFSFRAFDQNPKYVKANWIFILLSIVSVLVVIAIMPERRYLFFLLPFLIIFSVIPIQRVVEYGLSTFSFSSKQKNIFLVSVIFLVIIISGCFTVFGFGKPDLVFENEKKDFAKFVVDNLREPTLREFGPATDYVFFQIMTDPPGQFKQFKVCEGENCWKEYQELDENEHGHDSISIYGKSLDELVENGEEFNLKYIIAKKEGNFYSFLNDIYSNEENYPYLTKVFDSDEVGYKKLKLKVFEINYEEFHKG